MAKVVKANLIAKGLKFAVVVSRFNEFLSSKLLEGAEDTLLQHGVDEKGIDKKSGKVIVQVDPQYFRPTEVETLLGDPSKAKNKLGWVPRVSFKELVSEMVQSDLIEAKKDDLCRSHGFEIFDYNE